MKFTEEDKKQIKRWALRELQYNTHDPYEALIRGLEAWLCNHNMVIVNQKLVDKECLTED